MTSTCAIIVGFRNPSDILACLNGLAAQTRPVEHVVICENGGDDHAANLAQALAANSQHEFLVEIVSAPDNPGYAGGINRALAVAPKAELIWIINPDAVPDAGAHEAMANDLARGKYDAIGGVICTADGTIKTCGGHWNKATGYVAAIAHDRRLRDMPERNQIESRLSFISGANMLVTRNFINATGPMREDYFLYVEEVEWCLRAASKGMRLGFCPTALIQHEQGTATGSAVTHRERPRLPIYMDTRNRVLVVRDTAPLWLLSAIPAILVSVTVRYLARGAVRQWRDALSGWAAGITNERGKPAWAR